MRPLIPNTHHFETQAPCPCFLATATASELYVVHSITRQSLFPHDFLYLLLILVFLSHSAFSQRRWR